MPATPVQDASGELQFGARLRHARLVKGLLLKELAQQVGCTESFLSKLENDKARPSLQMLHALVSALDTSISALFSPHAAGSSRVMRAGERPHITTTPRKGPGVVIESLVPGGVLSLLYGSIHVVAPGGNSEGSITHKGEEIGYVARGQLELTVGEEIWLLNEGDSFFFPSSVPHAYRNPGSTEARVIWVNTPPTF